MDRQKYTGLLDMLNGGGAGRAGDTFEGGPLSGLLNALGIRPRGYRDRMDQMAQARPMPRPAGLGMAPRRAASPPPPTDYIGQHFERNMAPPPPPADYIGQHFKRNMAPPPAMDYIGQHFERNMASPPAMDYIGQHFERNMAPPPAPPVTPLAAPPPAAARPFGDDPGRVREFAEWFTTTYGPDAFGMLPQEVLQQKYLEWLDSRTGYRM